MAKVKVSEVKDLHENYNKAAEELIDRFNALKEAIDAIVDDVVDDKFGGRLGENTMIISNHILDNVEQTFAALEELDVAFNKDIGSFQRYVDYCDNAYINQDDLSDNRKRLEGHYNKLSNYSEDIENAFKSVKDISKSRAPGFSDKFGEDVCDAIDKLSEAIDEFDPRTIERALSLTQQLRLNLASSVGDARINIFDHSLAVAVGAVGIAKTIEGAVEKLDDLNLTELQSKLEGFKNKIHGIVESIKDLDLREKLDELREKLADIKNEIIGIIENLENLNLREKLDDLRSRLEEIKDAIIYFFTEMKEYLLGLLDGQIPQAIHEILLKLSIVENFANREDFRDFVADTFVDLKVSEFASSLTESYWGDLAIDVGIRSIDTDGDGMGQIAEWKEENPFQNRNRVTHH